MSVTLVVLFSLALVLGLVITPLIERLATKINALDLPGDRKLHRQPVPRLGGIAIYLSFIITLNSGLLLSDVLLQLFQKALRNWLGLIFGGSVVLALGIVDDIYEIRPRVKLLFQLLAALIVYASGLQITKLANPLDGILYLGWLALPVTLLWIVGITNAMNLIDGLDGLASGVALIITGTILFMSVGFGNHGIAVVSSILCGSSLAFLRYNFNPARIFMGDSGSMFLGFTLAVISLQGTQKSSTAVAILTPVLFFGLPIVDTLLAMWRRLIPGSGPSAPGEGWRLFRADRGHIHHKLIDLGLSHRAAVLTLYLVTLALSGTGFFLTAVRSEKAAVLLGVGIIATLALLAAFTGWYPRLRRGETRADTPGSLPLVPGTPYDHRG